MSENRRIVVNLEPPQPEPNASPNAARQTSTGVKSSFGQAEPPAKPKKRRGCLLAFGIVATLFIVIAAGIGIYLYWQWTTLQKSPTYSMALLIDAARKDDQKTVDQLLDTNAVVDNFVPQVKEKATERYGRGFPPDKVKAAEQLLTQYLNQMLPGIKERARREVPRVIKDRTASLPETSPSFVAIGINRLLSVNESGDTATLKGSLQEREVEIGMKRIENDRWKIVSVKDPQLADKIAQQAAQVILTAVNKKPGDARNQAKGTLDDLRKQIEQLVGAP